MKITILGAGAMGSLFGGYLSKENEVWLVEINESRVEKINAAGIRVREQTGEDTLWHPRAVTDTRGLPQMDLIIVFVKAMYTLNALGTNKRLIGPNTYLMTLQNGAGHEGKLLQYADRDHVVIGTTQHNSSVIENGYIHHGGRGKTLIGLLEGAGKELASIAENFSACGLECGVSDDVKRQIWNKLFTNTAASSLTAVLQVPLGFLWEDPHAHRLVAELCREAAAVANADCGGGFLEEQIIEGVETVCRNAPGGYTSIYADIREGRSTEVDTISGSVVEAAKAYGIPVPCHEMVVDLIHALENKNKRGIT